MSGTEYAVGDLVEVTDGEHVIRTRVVANTEDGDLCINPLDTDNSSEWAYLTWYQMNVPGRSIKRIEKAKPQLPTEHGAYSDKDGDLWVLTVDGEWHDFSTGNQTHHKPGMSPRNYAPFTRLAPVAEVLDKVHGIFGGPDALLHKDVDAIAAEYGISA